MEWLDAHAGSVQAFATLVLVALTAYYAWSSQALVRETRTTMQASARATLQARMDHLSDILIRQPELFVRLNDPDATGAEMDARFPLAGMLLSIIEEAHTQFTIERSMPHEDWSAWQATADSFLHNRYIVGYWRRTKDAFEPSFRRFVDGRLAALPGYDVGPPTGDEENGTG
jgi:hypothetical protein